MGADKALTRDGRNAKALYRKASALMQLLSFAEATSVLENLLEIEPGNAAAKSMMQDARRSAVRSEKREKRMAQSMFSATTSQRDARRPPTIWEAFVEFVQTLFSTVQSVFRTVLDIPDRCRDFVRSCIAELRAGARRRWRGVATGARTKLESMGLLRSRSVPKATASKVD